MPRRGDLAEYGSVNAARRLAANGEVGMKKFVVIAAMIAAFGLGGAAAFAATADKPASPPGQGECDHGNGDQNGNAGPCKDDPSENGKDCDQHGNNGGVNEDHCKSETTTTETTTTETTTTETTTETTTTETTTTETTTSTPTETTTSTPTESTPSQTTPAETTPSGEVEQPPAQEPGVFTPPAQKKQNVSASSDELVSAASQAKPSTAAQPAPFTP
jgi:hypothetical protein